METSRACEENKQLATEVNKEASQLISVLAKEHGHEAVLSKARRGELYIWPPIGYVKRCSMSSTDWAAVDVCCAIWSKATSRFSRETFRPFVQR